MAQRSAVADRYRLCYRCNRRCKESDDEQVNMPPPVGTVPLCFRCQSEFVRDMLRQQPNLTTFIFQRWAKGAGRKGAKNLVTHVAARRAAREMVVHDIVDKDRLVIAAEYVTEEYNTLADAVNRLLNTRFGQAWGPDVDALQTAYAYSVLGVGGPIG